MSYVEIFRITESGDVLTYDTARNNHGYAGIVWQYLMVQYGLHATGRPYELNPPWNYEPLWAKFDDGSLEPLDRILLGSTFDRVWVKKETLHDLIKAQRAFHEKYIVPNDIADTISKTADVIEALLAEDPSILGVAFNMCSANEPYWQVREDEEPRTYNIFADKDLPLGGEGKPAWELSDGDGVEEDHGKADSP